MSLFKNSLLPILFILFATTLSAQVYNYEDGEGPVPADSVGGFYFGLNLGGYWANANTAYIYGGYGYDRGGAILPFSTSWLNRAIQGDVTARNRTSTAMGLAPGEWQFTESDMPGPMSFTGSFMYGGHVRYMFNVDFGVFLEFNGTNPVTIGQFTIEDLTATNPDPSQNQRLRTFGIRGEEQRLMINMGLHKVMFRESREAQGKSTTVLPYFDAGVNMTFVKFEENFIDLGSSVGTVDLTIFFNQQGQYIDQANLLTGVGFGAFAGTGGQIRLARKFTIDIGYVASFEQIKLGEVNERGIQHQAIFKAIYMI